MSYYVAKKLNIEPNAILYKWTPAMLIVAFGQYANEESHRNFMEWQNLSDEQRSKHKQPQKYIVLFRQASDFVEVE